MPSNSPIAKRSAVSDTYGGIVTLCEPTVEARAAAAKAKVDELPRSAFIHPSEDPRVIAGQGTVSLELASQIEGELDVVIIPVGGGGLAGGNCVALRSLWGDRVKIVLAEPELANDAKRSFETGELCFNASPVSTVADGLKTNLGPNTFPIIKELADDVITCSEKDILACTRLVWERMKVMIEPSAATGVAVLLGDEFKRKYDVEKFKRVGIVLCGGNVDLKKVLDKMQEYGV